MANWGFRPGQFVLIGLLATGCNAELIEGQTVDGAVTGVDRVALVDTDFPDAGPLDGAIADVIGGDGDEAAALLDVPFDTSSLDAALVDASVTDSQDGAGQLSGCATAPEFENVGDVAFPGSTSGSSERLLSCSGASLQGGPVRWYRLQWAAVDVIVTATAPTEAGNPLVRFYEACPPVSCASGSVDPLGLMTVRAHYENPHGGHPFYVAVSSDHEGASSDFTFLVGFFPPVPPLPLNGVCTLAIRIHGGDTLYSQDLENAVDPATACGSGRIAALYYVVSVPGGQTLQVSAINDNLSGASHPTVPGMYLSSGCGSSVCLASGMTTSVPGEARVQWANTSSLSQDVILAVDSGDPHVYPFSFELVVTIQP